MDKTVLKKNHQAGNTTLPHLTLCYKAILTTTVWNDHEKTQINRTEWSRNKPRHIQPTCKGEAKNIQDGEDGLFNKY